MAIVVTAGAAGGIGGFFPPLVMGIVRQEFGAYFVGFLLLALFAAGCWFLNVRKTNALTTTVA